MAVIILPPRSRMGVTEIAVDLDERHNREARSRIIYREGENGAGRYFEL